MKQLSLRQRAFKAEEITYLDRKFIHIDRMLLNLFELLRFDGRPPVKIRRRPVDVGALVNLMRQRPDCFVGFDARPEVARAWLENDLLEIMNRGKPGREMVVGPRPFHLNAFKLANSKAVQDYGASMQVWAMLLHADPTLLTRLKEFFGRGLDVATDRYDRRTTLDLETLAVLGLVDQVHVGHATVPASKPLEPVCLGQGQLLADDLRRLLAYEDVVPRHVLADYIRTAMGLHLALFVLRLFRLVPALVAQAQRRELGQTCPLDEGTSHDVTTCPYRYELVVDLTDDRTSPSGALAICSAAEHVDSITAYVRAVILLNRVKEFASYQAALGRRPPVRTIHDLLAVVADPPPDMVGFFDARIAEILGGEAGEAENPVVEAILRLEELSSLEKYVELVCIQRMKNERRQLIGLMDSLAQKNRPGGFLKQTAGARAPRWFVLGSHLLETLVQIAVIERDTSGRLRSHTMLIDDFTEWLRTRYGMVIYAPAYREVLPEEQEAWRRNRLALRERLHQIGFFTDLSDAFNSQTLRPRYKVRIDA